MVRPEADVTGLLTARAVAELLEVSPETVLRWTRKGQLPAVRLPSGALRYREAALERWLEERATPSRGASPTPASAAHGVRYLASPTPEVEED
jgi:excisionase family DNA binding protein